MTGQPSSDILAALDFPAPTPTCDGYGCTRKATHRATLGHGECLGTRSTHLICAPCAKGLIGRVTQTILIAFVTGGAAYCEGCRTPIRHVDEFVSAKPL